ncbi:MAG: toprim domain-containing protein [Methylibium sp.]|nr:toprim domain-containing protein [Methylibium sp.]
MSFIDFCRSHGILIDSLPPMGLWKRFKTEDKANGKRNGAVKWMGDHGFVQNWATDQKVEVWHDERTTIDPAARAASQARLRAQHDRERDQRKLAIQGARRFWANAHPLSRPHPYIEKKGLSPLGCAGLRTHDGLLVVPVWWGDALVSVQTITAEGEKRFWPGAPVKGGAYVLDRPRAALTAFCEGVATGLAIYQSVRQARVVVAFDCGNLVRVIERIKPTGSVVICADNDTATFAKRGFNPGLDAAQEVAETIGCGVWAPMGIEGTDAADFMKELGTAAAKRMEREILAQARVVMA